MGPSPVLSRAVGPPTSRKAGAEPGRLIFAIVKRSRPADPAYCKDAIVLRKISRSRVTVQKWIFGATMFLARERVRRLGANVTPGMAGGPKLFTLSGIGGMITPLAAGVSDTSVGIAKLALSWKNGARA